MIIFPKTGAIRFSATLIAIVAAALAISFLSGREAIKSCLSAVTVTALAACISLVPRMYVALYKPVFLPFSTLAAGVLRLLLMLAGSIIIIVLVKVNILWFVVWIGVFYSSTLIGEITFAIHAANRREITEVGTF